MTFYIGEYLIDELEMDIDKADEVADECLKIAIANYK